MRSRDLLFGTLAAASFLLTVALVVPAIPTSAQAATGGAQGPQVPTIKWSRLDDAVNVATQSGKPVFVTVYADWCGYCKLMDRTTFTDPNVVKLLQGWVPAKLNGESVTPLKLGNGTMTENQWAMRNGVSGFPATFLLDSKGKAFAGVPGYLEAPQMSRLLQDASAYLKAGGASKLGNFFEWIAKRP